MIMKLLNNTAQRLIINGTLIEQPELFCGKIGIAVFSSTVRDIPIFI